MHRLRVLSALLLLLPFFLIVRFGSPFQFHLLLSAAILLCAWEFAWLCPVGGDRRMAVATTVGALALQWSMISGTGTAAIPPAVAVAMLVWATAGREEFRTSVLQAAWTLLGAVYAGGLLGHGSILRGSPAGRDLVFFVAFTTWAGDIGAYYVGSRLGRRALAPRISPRKTVEGAIGGIAATVLVAALGSGAFWPRLSLATAVWVGAVLAAAGILGDLAESAIKRAAGVKDSGTIIPGHGGVLDRLDSVIFACPVLYALAWMGWV